MSDLVLEAVGWAGMVTLLSAYGLRDRLTLRMYDTLNFLGAAAVGVVCYSQETWPALALETAWAGIAAWRLVMHGKGSHGGETR